MNEAKLLEELSAEFSVIVHTPYHVQIETPRGPHNIWFSKGSIKFQPRGDQGLELCHGRRTQEASADLRLYQDGSRDNA